MSLAAAHLERGTAAGARGMACRRVGRRARRAIVVMAHPMAELSTDSRRESGANRPTGVGSAVRGRVARRRVVVGAREEPADGVDEMVTLFHVTGGYTYVDPMGEALGYEDVFTKLENARRHFDAIGLGGDHVKRLVR